MLHSPHRAARWGVALLIALAGLVPVPAATAATAWHVTARLGLGSAGAVSCPSTATCWALSGGALLYSDSGGARWTDVSARVPQTVDALDAFDCPAEDVCYLAGRATDGHIVVETLTAQGDHLAVLPGTNPILSLSCPTGDRCVAVDRSNVYVTADTGATWSLAATLADNTAQAVDCAPASRRCWAVGGNGNPTITRSLDGGLTWRSQRAPDVPGAYFGVDCPTTVDCYAVGQGDGLAGTIAVTHDAGATWTAPHLSPDIAPYPLYSIDCPTASVCAASGGPAAFGVGSPYALRTTNGGGRWRPVYYPPHANTGAIDLSCPAAAICVGVAEGVFTLRTVDGGTTWTSSTILASLRRLDALECPTDTRCFGLTSDDIYRKVALMTDDAGRTWSRHVLPDDVAGVLAGFDCPTALACLALYVNTTFDGQTTRTTGTLVSTTDGGATWTARTNTALNRLRQLDCPTATTCLAIGVRPNIENKPAVYATTDAGATWTLRTMPANLTALGRVACGSPTACVLLGTNVPGGPTLAAATADLGATYTAGALPAARFYFRLDCVESSCFVLGGAQDYRGIVAASTDGGVTWTQQTLPARAVEVQTVSCRTTRICLITAANGSENNPAQAVVGTTDGGATWRLHPLPTAGLDAPDAAACLSDTVCLVDGAGAGGLRILAGSP